MLTSVYVRSCQLSLYTGSSLSDPRELAGEMSKQCGRVVHFAVWMITVVSNRMPLDHAFTSIVCSDQCVTYLFSCNHQYILNGYNY